MKILSHGIAGGAAEIIAHAILILDANLHVKEANRSFYALFHLEEKEVENRLLFDLGNGAWNIPALRAFLVRAGSAESRLDVEIEQDFPVLGRRRLRISVERFLSQNSAIPLLLLSVNDTTERTQAEQALSESEAYVRSFFEQPLVGMAITSSEKHMLMVNDKLCDLLGYSREELLDLAWDEITHPDDTAADVAQFDRVIAGEIDGYSLDKRFIRKNGQPIYVIMTCHAVRDTQGKVTHFAKLVQDITDRREAEEEIQRHKEQAILLGRQTLDAQEIERGRISRELHDEAGQTLTLLKIGLALMIRDLAAESEALRLPLTDAVSSVDEVLRQIRLLASNLRPPELEMLELNNVLENYCKDFSSRTRIPVEYLGTTTKALGKITETCLYRFLQEALTNVARHASAKRVRVRLGSNDDTISLLIEDDGRGFILETQATMGIPPLHLGLSNMRERLSLLGGWLEVHSKPGQGTRLLAHIPREEIQ
jgi:two-component system sensor histidine kinase UhpB